MADIEEAGVEAIRGRTHARITHPGRVLYPAMGVTKLDVIGYYRRVAPFLLPYLHDRPITMHRFPDGVEGKGFFAKDAPAGTPAFVETFTHWAEAPGRDVDFVLCNNLDPGTLPAGSSPRGRRTRGGTSLPSARRSPDAAARRDDRDVQRDWPEDDRARHEEQEAGPMAFRGSSPVMVRALHLTWDVPGLSAGGVGPI